MQDKGPEQARARAGKDQTSRDLLDLVKVWSFSPQELWKINGGF